MAHLVNNTATLKFHFTEGGSQGLNLLFWSQPFEHMFNRSTNKNGQLPLPVSKWLKTLHRAYICVCAISKLNNGYYTP